MRNSTGKVGIVGFCWGGGLVNRVASIAPPELAAAVAYYGPAPQDKSRVPNIKAPLLLHYGGLDANVNPGIPGYEEALKAAGKRYTIHMYEGAQHSFNNDTAGPRYSKEAADLAWSRTVAFFKANLGRVDRPAPRGQSVMPLASRSVFFSRMILSENRSLFGVMLPPGDAEQEICEFAPGILRRLLPRSLRGQ